MNVCLNNIHLNFDGAEVLKGLSLNISSGDIVVVQGPSGCGKTSLLRVINRLQTPTCGEILADGEPVTGYSAPAWRRRVGYLQQTPVMISGTVRDNLLLPFRLASAYGSAPEDRALELGLSEFLLADVKLTADAGKLSVGQQQRVALLRIILACPRLLLCDEPTSALDAESRRIVEEGLERLATEQAMGILLVTHLHFKPSSAPVRYLRFVDGHLQKEGEDA